VNIVKAQKERRRKREREKDVLLLESWTNTLPSAIKKSLFFFCHKKEFVQARQLILKIYHNT